MKTSQLRKNALSFVLRHNSISMMLILMLGSLILQTSCGKKDKGPIVPDLQLVADGLAAPVLVVEPPDNSHRLFIVDQVGKIWIVNGDKKLDQPFLDVSSKMVPLTSAYDERGLLGLAFHPDFSKNGKFYVFYTAPPRAGGPMPGYSWDNLTRISEFKASGNRDLADANSERIILEADHPQFNHDGGTIAFGNDGYLYISIGDGGGADDNDTGHVNDWYPINAGGNAQNFDANLMGKVLRIDVNSGNPYSIPVDNPFYGSPRARPEIWAYGFRNPYRFSFDMGGSRQMFLSDAGQGLYEEIDIVTRGGNYGWNVKEGFVCFNTDSNSLIRPSCPNTDSAGQPLKDPILVLPNASNPAGGIATVVVGGHVYRGGAIPSLSGRYIFGIFCQDLNFAPDAKIYVASSSASGAWPYEELKFKNFQNNLGQYLKGMGQDQSGEVYLTTSGALGPTGATGKVYRIIGVRQ